jgi:hypothetical protein
VATKVPHARSHSFFIKEGDNANMGEFGVTITGQPFVHRLYHLPFALSGFPCSAEKASWRSPTSSMARSPHSVEGQHKVERF